MANRAPARGATRWRRREGAARSFPLAGVHTWRTRAESSGRRTPPVRYPWPAGPLPSPRGTGPQPPPAACLPCALSTVRTCRRNQTPTGGPLHHHAPRGGAPGHRGEERVPRCDRGALARWASGAIRSAGNGAECAARRSRRHAQFGHCGQVGVEIPQGGQRHSWRKAKPGATPARGDADAGVDVEPGDERGSVWRIGIAEDPSTRATPGQPWQAALQDLERQLLIVPRDAQARRIRWDIPLLRGKAEEVAVSVDIGE